MSRERDEFAGQLWAQTLAAFGLKPWQAGLGPVPWHVRLWHATTFARRRGKVVDWRSYNAAEAGFRARQEAFGALLRGRAQDVADDLSAALPDGLRFGWAVTPEPQSTGTGDGQGSPARP